MTYNPTFWPERRVLVTGATGLLGSWLCHELLAHGAQLVCLVRDEVPQSELVRSGNLLRVTRVRGDLSSVDALARIIGEYETEFVFHLAAQTIVGAANRDPLPTFEANIAGTWNLLEACRRAGRFLQCVTVASSDKAYGAAPQLPYDEETPLRGQHPYDVSKSCADLIAQSYAVTYGLPVAVARCGNLFGGGDLNFSRIIPGTIRSILREEPPLIRSDGQFVRDYLYIEDAVGAYLSLAQYVAHNPERRGEGWNFSLEQPLSVLELVQLLSERMGYAGRPKVCNEASHEIRAQHLSSRKAREALNWTPRHGMADGLDQTIAWYRRFLTDRT